MMTNADIIEQVKTAMEAVATEQNRLSGQRFFKEDVCLIGVKSSDAGNVAKTCYDLVKDFRKEELFNVCEELWATNCMELCFVACNWSLRRKKEFVEADFEVFEKWVSSYITNWATCDTFCNHNVGEFVMKFPKYVERLKLWAKSDNRWVKRAAAVSLIIPARKGLFHKDIYQIADILLLDKDDMVQKGYGWMLKSASQFDQKTVFDYVCSKKSIMPRTALRYAIEKMPEDLRKVAMQK
jgi:3-methyladenine DNA glycosylase AlkD